MTPLIQKSIYTGIGGASLFFALLVSASAQVPLSLLSAYLFAASVTLVSIFWGFSVGFWMVCIEALFIALVHDAPMLALAVFCVAGMWYLGVTLVAAQGSRVLLGVSAAALFAGLMVPRMSVFTLSEGVIFLALCGIEGVSMYFFAQVFARAKAWYA